MSAEHDAAIAEELAWQCAEQMWSNDHASKALGMSLEAVAVGAATITMTVRRDMVNGLNICHGGLIFALSDSAFAFACNSQNEAAVAASCTIEFLRPAKLDDTLTATAKMVHQGRRTGIYDIKVSNQRGEVVAQFRGRSARIGQPVVVSPVLNVDD